MSRSNIVTPDSALDLVLERVVDVPRELVWAAWTTPEHILKWFTPAPWKTVDCEIDLLVLEAGYRPSKTISQPDGLPFTAVITLEPHGKGTKYTAVAIHGREDVRKRHEAMGFHDGWGKALSQLVALVKTIKA